jgi:hypothetical protein
MTTDRPGASTPSSRGIPGNGSHPPTAASRDSPGTPHRSGTTPERQRTSRDSRPRPSAIPATPPESTALRWRTLFDNCPARFTRRGSVVQPSVLMHRRGWRTTRCVRVVSPSMQVAPSRCHDVCRAQEAGAALPMAYLRDGGGCLQVIALATAPERSPDDRRMCGQLLVPHEREDDCACSMSSECCGGAERRASRAPVREHSWLRGPRPRWSRSNSRLLSLRWPYLRGLAR